ncbi:MAG: DUF1003 domain-containing protein [Acidobacteria bacterium]|nr:DUF1003 domain-containing protein [Acidobacteriota bacterium]
MKKDGAGKRSKKKDKQAKHSIEKETESNVLEIVRLENEQREKRGRSAKVLQKIALFCGSLPFVYVHALWFGGWIALNTLSPYSFDPPPFTYLWLIVSFEAFFISTFILISQNHEAELTERRNHLDLQINMLVERENTKLLRMLKAIGDRIGVDAHDEEVHALMQDVEPEKLVDQIIKASDPNSIAPGELPAKKKED